MKIDTIDGGAMLRILAEDQGEEEDIAMLSEILEHFSVRQVLWVMRDEGVSGIADLIYPHKSERW